MVVVVEILLEDSDGGERSRKSKQQAGRAVERQTQTERAADRREGKTEVLLEVCGGGETARKSERVEAGRQVERQL